jgi:hypothetical protein
MTAERKASIKGTLTLGFSGASLLGVMWVGSTLSQINHTLTYSTSVQDISDWQAAIERSNNGACIRVPDFWAIWARNHETRKGVIGGIP